MTNKFRKTEKTSAKNSNLIIILAVTLFLVMISGAAALMSREETPKENSANKAVENYTGKTPEIEGNSEQNITIEKGDNSASVNSDVKEKEEENDQKPVFSFPCEEEIVCKYSGTTPVFSEVLDDWRTHPATDYASETQFDVKAAADGQIEDIYSDGLMGITVLIDHGNEIKSVYQSLDENVSVKKGDKVTAGTVIGKAGTTAVTENYENKYMLHFALLENGEYKDPAELISQ